MQQTGRRELKRKIQALSDTNQTSISFITSVQIQHSLGIKVTFNYSGSRSIIQCLLLYGLTLYKSCCVLLSGACKTRGETLSFMSQWRGSSWDTWREKWWELNKIKTLDLLWMLNLNAGKCLIFQMWAQNDPETSTLLSHSYILLLKRATLKRFPTLFTFNSKLEFQKREEGALSWV